MCAVCRSGAVRAEPASLAGGNRVAGDRDGDGRSGGSPAWCGGGARFSAQRARFFLLGAMGVIFEKRKSCNANGPDCRTAQESLDVERTKKSRKVRTSGVIGLQSVVTYSPPTYIRREASKNNACSGARLNSSCDAATGGASCVIENPSLLRCVASAHAWHAARPLRTVTQSRRRPDALVRLWVLAKETASGQG